GVPVGQRANMVGGDVHAVLGAQQVLQQHLQAVGKPLDAVDGIQAEDFVRLVTDTERVAAAETVRRHGCRLLVSPLFQASCPSGTAGASLRLPLQDHSRAGTALPVMRGTTGTTCVDDPDSARGAAE